MPLETWRHVPLRGAHANTWAAPAQPALRTGPSRSSAHRRRSMTNLLPQLRLVLEDLTQRFGEDIEHSHSPQSNELYLHTKMELAGALCSAFYRKHQGRLAGVFAEDARAEHKVFFIYYLYMLDASHGFVFVRVPVPQDNPEMLSVANAVPAINWQERE